MFAGGRRKSSNVRVMQLFHELKQQFPTVPDHIVTACISEFANRNIPEGISEHDKSSIHQVLKTAEILRVTSATIEDNKELMGRTPTQATDAQVSLSEPITDDKINETVIRSEMNESDNDINRNVVKSKFGGEIINSDQKHSPPQRPNYLEIKPKDDTVSDGFNKIQPSERCFDLQKLLNPDNLYVKPPRSPVVSKRFVPKNKIEDAKSPLDSPENARKGLYNQSIDSGHCSTSALSPPNSNAFDTGGPKKLDSPGRKPETVETPTQTSDTLLGTGSVNLSLNVNCQMDLVQSPTIPKRSSVLNLTPQMPWCQDPTSQRSYTSVNLTLRPPSAEPQPPIDITSQNASLTYSTSSFDSQKGLQSRLQITVGPGGGSVSSVRTRPRSSYSEENKSEETVPVRVGCMSDVATNKTSPVIRKQQVRIDKLRIELSLEKNRLVEMQEEVENLSKPFSITFRADAEKEKQLQKEIMHLRGQCERLTYDVDRQSESRGETSEEFYRNIYTGQRGPLTLGSSERRQVHQPLSQIEVEGPKWNCHMCTFQNHPLLDKCEQCEMPRILHGMKPEPPNPCFSFGMVRSNSTINEQENNDDCDANTNTTTKLNTLTPTFRLSS
ncbi:hypothetical protein FQR65_LT01729 [Abscondita terminalis]|nr:hypothetical protein FQR65_LT01729 [Abscondita terminalis]